MRRFNAGYDLWWQIWIHMQGRQTYQEKATDVTYWRKMALRMFFQSSCKKAWCPHQSSWMKSNWMPVTIQTQKLRRAAYIDMQIQYRLWVQTKSHPDLHNSNISIETIAIPSFPNNLIPPSECFSPHSMTTLVSFNIWKVERIIILLIPSRSLISHKILWLTPCTEGRNENVWILSRLTETFFMLSVGRPSIWNPMQKSSGSVDYVCWW